MKSHPRQRPENKACGLACMLERIPVFGISFCNISCTPFALIICLPPPVGSPSSGAWQTRPASGTLWQGIPCADCSHQAPRAGPPRHHSCLKVMKSLRSNSTKDHLVYRIPCRRHTLGWLAVKSGQTRFELCIYYECCR